MSDNNDDATSEIVAEVQYNAAVPTMNQQIDNLIVYDDNQHNMTFGQSENSLADRQRVVNILRRRKIGMCIAAAILLVFVRGCVRLVSSLDGEDKPVDDALMYVTLDDNQQGHIMPEESSWFCANAIEENDLNVNINNEINAPITYTSKRTRLKATPVIEIVDGSTYNIIASIPTDHDEKTDASKIEPNGAVSIEDARPTNLYIPKERIPMDSNEEIVEENAA